MHSDKDQHPSEMEANNDKNEKGESPKIPALSAEEDSVPVCPESVGDKSKCKEITSLEDRLDRVERRESRLTVVIAFAAVVSALVALLQWDTMRGELDEMRENGQQTDRLIAQVTEQAKAAVQSLDASQQQFQREQRPYVMPRANPMVFSPNREIVVNIVSGNYGKTPAMKIGIAINIFTGKDALKQAYQWFDKEAPKVHASPYGANIPPATPASSIEATTNTVRTRQVISKKKFSAIDRMNFGIVVAMRQAYLDIFGNEYWTDFCVGRLAPNPLAPQGAIAYCPQHNEIH